MNTVELDNHKIQVVAKIIELKDKFPEPLIMDRVLYADDFLVDNMSIFLQVDVGSDNPFNEFVWSIRRYVDHYKIATGVRFEKILETMKEV